MCPLSLRLRVRISIFLFAALIFLDAIAAFNTVVFSELFHQKLNSTTVDSPEEDIQKEQWGPGGGDTRIRSSAEADRETVEYSATIAMMELFGLSILLVSNLSALLGMRRMEAYLLVPWLFVYLIGISRLH